MRTALLSPPGGRPADWRNWGSERRCRVADRTGRSPSWRSSEVTTGGPGGWACRPSGHCGGPESEWLFDPALHAADDGPTGGAGAGHEAADALDVVGLHRLADDRRHAGLP